MTDPVEEFALFVADVFELAGALRRSGDELAGLVGQTQARWQVLSVMSTGEHTVASAARRLGVARQGVQRIADLLVADGLATLEPNPAHQRAPLVRLTPAGRRTFAAITRSASTRNAEVVDGVAAAELVRTRHLLRTLIERLPHGDGKDGD